jgi:WD40 repeat protein
MGIYQSLIGYKLAKKWIVTTFFLIFLFSIFSVIATNNLNQRTVINAENVQLLEKLVQFEQGSVWGAIWSPDGNYIFATGSLGVWRFDAHNLAEEPLHLAEYRSPLTLSPDNRTAASLNADYNIVLWDTQTGELIEVFYDVGSRLIGINDLAFSPDGSQLAMGFGDSTNMGWTGAITVWDMTTRETYIDTQRVIDDPVVLGFSADGTRLAAGGYGGLAAWDTRTWERLLMPYGSYVSNVEYSLNADRVGYWYWRNDGVFLFDLHNTASQSCRPSNPFSIKLIGGDVAFSPIDNNILAVSQYEKLALWDVDSCEMLTMIPVVLPDIAFSPDGSQLLGVDGSNIHIYSANNLTEVASVGGYVASLSNMAFSGDLIAYKTNSYDALNDLSSLSVRAWETESFSQVAHVTFETNLDELTIPFLRNHIKRESWSLEGMPDVIFNDLKFNPPSAGCITGTE